MKKTSSLWKIKLRNLTAECENASLWKMFIVQTDVCSDSMSICQMCIRFILVKSCQSLYILAALSRAAGFPLWFHVLILIKDSSCSRLEMKRSDALRWFVLVQGFMVQCASFILVDVVGSEQYSSGPQSDGQNLKVQSLFQCENIKYPL